MKKKHQWWKYLLRILVVIALVPLTYLGFKPMVRPWMEQRVDRMIAKWEALQDEATALMKEGKFDAAESRFREALAYAEERFGPDTSRAGSSAFRVGGALLVQEKFDEARTYFERNLSIEEKREGKSSPTLCVVLKRLIEISMELGAVDAALDYAQRAVSIREAQNQSPDSELASALHDLASVYERQKNYAVAAQVRKRIVKIAEAEYATRSRELGIAYYREALMYDVLEDLGEAEKLYQKGLAVLKENVEPDAECIVMLVREYARLLETTGRLNDAARVRASVRKRGDWDEVPSSSP